jgi:fumarylacetoacetate (FAA) hydrolase
MKFASLNDGSLDGQLLVVSRDLSLAVSATADIAPNLITAVQQDALQAPLQELSDTLNAGMAKDSFALDPHRLAAPAARAAVAGCVGILNHGKLMESLQHATYSHFDTVPVMYQGASDDLKVSGPTDGLPGEAHGIDFSGEFGVYWPVAMRSHA